VKAADKKDSKSASIK